MSAIAIKFKNGPVTFAAEAPVKGGQVVMAGTEPRTCLPATAAAGNVIGVALIDAEPKGDAYKGLPENTSVATVGHHVPVKGDGSLAVGDVVIAGDDGTVAKSGGSEPQSQIIGRVVEVLSDDDVLVRLYV